MKIKKQQQYLNELYEDKALEEKMIVIATQGNKKRIYENIRTYSTLQKIIDYRKGWEIKIINK